MIRYGFVLVFCLKFVVVYSQKVDLDPLPIRVSYIQLPRNPLPVNLTTYSCDFITTGYDISKLGYSMERLQQAYYALNGFKRLPRGGHFIITTQIDPPQSTSLQEITETQTVKDKEGKESKVTTFAYEYSYYVPMRYVIKDYQQNIIQEGALSDGSQAAKGRTDYFKTSAALAEYWKTQGIGHIQKNWGAYLGQALSGFADRLNKDYGYVPVKQNRRDLWILNGPKHPEYSAYQKIYQLIKEAFDEMTPEGGLSLPKLTPAINYLDSLSIRFPGDDKAYRKLRYSAYYNLGWIYYWLCDFDKANKNAEALIANDYDKRDGNVLKTNIGSAQTLLSANRLRNWYMARNLDNVVAPRNAVVEQAELEEKEKKRQEALDRLMALGQAAQESAEKQKIVRQKSLDEAQQKLKVLAEQIAKDPKNPKLYQEQGATYIKIEEYALAAGAYEKATQLALGEVTYFRALGRCSLNAGNKNKALEAFKKVAQLAPKDPGAYEEQANLLYDMQRYAEAIPLYSTALQLAPKSSILLTNRGYSYEYLDQHEAALADFEKSLTYYIKGAHAFVGVGIVKNQQGKYQEAIKAFDKAMTFISNMPTAAANRAYSYIHLGKVEEAIKDADLAVRIDKQYAGGYYMRAYVRVWQKNYQGAIEDARLALSLNDPKPHRVYTILGDAMLGLGIVSEAIKNYDEALRIRPEYEGALIGKEKAKAIK